jgi:hypothetical protein
MPAFAFSKRKDTHTYRSQEGLTNIDCPSAPSSEAEMGRLGPLNLQISMIPDFPVDTDHCFYMITGEDVHAEDVLHHSGLCFFGTGLIVTIFVIWARTTQEIKCNPGDRVGLIFLGIYLRTTPGSACKIHLKAFLFMVMN